MNEEIKEFIEFRTDEDGTYFYYNDKDNIEQWSYKLDDLKEYITNLQQENARLKDKIDMINKLLNEPIFEYDNIPCNIENEIIQLKNILKEN